MTGPCTTCRFADWKRNKVGQLHPSGDGNCIWRLPLIPIPQAKYYMSGVRNPPQPFGGHIERKKPHEHCPTWEAKS